MSDELKPCPFCNGEARMWRSGIVRKKLCACSDNECGAYSAEFTPEEWNIRASETPTIKTDNTQVIINQQKRIEELEESLEDMYHTFVENDWYGNTKNMEVVLKAKQALLNRVTQMIKLTILLLLANDRVSLVHSTYDTVNECKSMKQYLQNQIQHKKVVFACLEGTKGEVNETKNQHKSKR
jgi:hypothetical protein